MLIALGLIVPAAYLQLVLHELSHVIACKMTGATLLAFKPYPHHADGQWWLGRTWWQGGGERRWWWSAPLFMAALVAIAGVVLGSFVWRPLFVLAATAVLDALWWWRGYFGLWSKDPALLDGWRWRRWRTPS